MRLCVQYLGFGLSLCVVLSWHMSLWHSHLLLDSLFLATVLFVQQIWTETELRLTFYKCTRAQIYIGERNVAICAQVPDCEKE